LVARRKCGERMIKKVVVLDHRWQFLEPAQSLLLNPKTGKMCCMGLAAAACGVPLHRLARVETLQRVSYPAEELTPEMQEFVQWVEANKQGSYQEGLYGVYQLNDWGRENRYRVPDGVSPDVITPHTREELVALLNAELEKLDAPFVLALA
jgi:hypothetical protein